MSNESVWVTLEEASRDALLARQTDYVKVFSSPVGKRVLKDLMTFCRVGEVAIGPDDRTTNILQGRQEVAVRILQHMKLSQEELWNLYSGKGRIR